MKRLLTMSLCALTLKSFERKRYLNNHFYYVIYSFAEQTLIQICSIGSLLKCIYVLHRTNCKMYVHMKDVEMDGKERAVERKKSISFQEKKIEKAFFLFFFPYPSKQTWLVGFGGCSRDYRRLFFMYM